MIINNMKNIKKTSMNKKSYTSILSAITLIFLSISLQGQSYFNPLMLSELSLSHSRDVALAGANTSEYTTAMNTFTNPANQAGFTGLTLTGSFAAIATKRLLSTPPDRKYPTGTSDNN